MFSLSFSSPVRSSRSSREESMADLLFSTASSVWLRSRSFERTTSSIPPETSFLYLAMKGMVAPPAMSSMTKATLSGSRDSSEAILFR